VCAYVRVLSHRLSLLAPVLQVMPNATLIVKTVMTDDVGQYQCQAVNLMGSSVANVLVSYRGEAGVLYDALLLAYNHF